MGIEKIYDEVHDKIFLNSSLPKKQSLIITDVILINYYVIDKSQFSKLSRTEQKIFFMLMHKVNNSKMR